MEKLHRWNTEAFEERTKELYRTELHKMYPSESWCLYRIMPECQSVLDLGCGNGAMAAIVHQISSDTKYTGMDHQENLMREANEVFPFANFFANDLEPFIESCDEFDAVMSWSVLKSFGNWREIIEQMINKAIKYVIFDLRIANVNKETWDKNVCWADYGGEKGPILVVNYSILKDYLLSHSNIMSRIELASYQSGFGKFVHFKDEEPEQFIVSIVLTKKDQSSSDECVVYEQLPANLQK